MATVDATAVTRLHDLEGAPTFVTIGGGAGAALDVDNYIQGTQSGGRLADLKTNYGFYVDDGAGNDLSAPGTHVGLWFNVVQLAAVTALRIHLASNTTNADDVHTVPLTEIPPVNGWTKIWVEVARAPEVGGSAVESALRYFGVSLDIGNVAQSSGRNMFMDAVDATTTGLLLTGTSGLFTDFTSADQDNANRYGIVIALSGVIYCKGRLTLGSANSLVFNDSDFTVVFPNQALVSNTFMGMTVDLQNASTDIDWARGILSSPGVKKGDLIFTGTSGAFNAVGCSFNGLRVITLTSKPVFDGCAFNGCGLITAPGATLTNASINGHTSTGVLWNANVETDGKLDGSSFTMGTANHAIELGANTPSSITLRNVSFSGYGADSTTSAAIYNNSGKSITINIVGGDTPTIRNGAGASTNVVSGTVTTSLRVTNTSGGNIEGANVLLKASDGTGPFPYQDAVTIVNSGTTATVTHTGHGLATNDKVLIKGASLPANNGVFVVTVTDPNTYTYTMSSAPGSNPTGATSTWVALNGLTDATGIVTMSRVIPSNQPVNGWARKSSSSPYYKTAGVSGTISSTTGLSASVQMLPDE